MKKTLFFITLLFTYSALAIKDGHYRLELTTQYAKIPFIIKASAKGGVFELINGSEVIKLENLHTKKKNHLTLQIPTYQVQLSLDTLGDKLSGHFIRSNGILMPLAGGPGKTLFKETRMVPSDFNGKWAVTDHKGEVNILLLEQTANKIQGSYLTKYGDYRTFSGVVNGSEFNAASFDGVYNYLIKGELHNNELKAQILANYQIELKGKRDPKAKLPDPYQLTQATEKLAFSFPDLQGKSVSLSDQAFAGKPVIIQIFGSWCPNCIEELDYLIPWYAANAKRGIEIIAVSFERTNDLKRAQMILKKLASKHQLNYPMLIAGVSATDTPEKKLAGLKNFMAFPTTLFLDKKHNVFKVHTGFTGPSTKEFYEQWILEFNATVDQLLK